MIKELEDTNSHIKILQQNEKTFDNTLKTLKEEHAKTLISSVQKSRQVNDGLAIENLAPLFTRFNPKDMCFLGKPIDYVVFDGLEDLYNGKIQDIRGIHFIEVKSNKATFSKGQRKIRDWIATNPNKITFELLRIQAPREQNGSSTS